MNYLYDFISLALFLMFVAAAWQICLPLDCSAKIVICKHTAPISKHYFAKYNPDAPARKALPVVFKLLVIGIFKQP